MTEKSMREAVAADVAQKTGVLLADVAVKSWNTVWNDSSLGVPVSGYSYLQVITPGLIVEAIVGNRKFTYHTDLEIQFVCVEEETTR